MPRFCIDGDPSQIGDRQVHDATPGRCPHLPPPEYREDLGWHRNVHGALAVARFTYKSATPCFFHCYDEAHKGNGGRDDRQAQDQWQGDVHPR